MKWQIKNWTLQIAFTGLFIAGLLLIIVLNPSLTYANKTSYNNFSIFHNKPLNPFINSVLDQATALLKTTPGKIP